MKYLILALAFAGVAHAQRVTPCNLATPNNAVCIVYSAPTTNTDGSPIAGPLTYRTERLTGSTWVPVGTIPDLMHYVTNLPVGTHNFRVVAIDGGRESDPSNTASRDVVQPAPNPPVIQVVQVVIGVDHAPVFTVLANGTRSSTWGGFARVGTACEGPALFTYLGYEWRKPVQWDRRKGISATARVAAPCS